VPVLLSADLQGKKEPLNHLVYPSSDYFAEGGRPLAFMVASFTSDIIQEKCGSLRLSDDYCRLYAEEGQLLILVGCYLGPYPCRTSEFIIGAMPVEAI